MHFWSSLYDIFTLQNTAFLPDAVRYVVGDEKSVVDFDCFVR